MTETPAVPQPAGVLTIPMVTVPGRVDEVKQKALVPLQAGKAELALTNYGATAETRQSMDCRTMLDPEARAQAEAEALKEIDKLLSNAQALAMFGVDAVSAYNQVIDELFNNRKDWDSPEVRNGIRQLRKGLRGATKKWDPTDPEVLAKYESFKAGVINRIRGITTIGEAIMSDFLPLGKQMASLTDIVEDQIEVLGDVVISCDALYKLGETLSQKIAYKVAVMQFMQDEALRRAKAERDGRTKSVEELTMEGNRSGEREAILEQFSRTLGNKIMNYKMKLFGAYTTAPRIRMARQVAVDQIVQLTDYVYTVLPSMKELFIEWDNLAKSVQGAAVGAEIRKSHEEVQLGLSRASSVAYPQMIESGMTPPLSIEAVKAVGDYFVQQCDNALAATERGLALQKATEEEMVRVVKVVTNKNSELTEALVDQMIASAQPGANGPILTAEASVLPGSTTNE